MLVFVAIIVIFQTRKGALLLEYYARPLLKSDTTIQRYNDTAIHGTGAGAGAMHKLYKLLPSITTGDISKNISRGGAYT